jgi:hypothetical protein
MTRVDGLVLARVGEHRLAFPATAITVVERWKGGPLQVAHARALYALEPGPGRLLLADTDGIVVDSLEIFRDSAKVAAVPRVLHRALSGALLGFVTIGQELWPLLDVATLSRAIIRMKATA